jgi:hypothetical protein
MGAVERRAAAVAVAGHHDAVITEHGSSDQQPCDQSLISQSLIAIVMVMAAKAPPVATPHAVEEFLAARRNLFIAMNLNQDKGVSANDIARTVTSAMRGAS